MQMSNDQSSIKSAEETQSAQEFISTVAPMTATSGQVNILRELGQITNRDSVLETWCGGGDLTAQLAKIAGRVVGADYSEKLINAARKRFPHIEFEISDADALAFSDESFDVVVSNSAAHHYLSPEKNFSEAGRVLKRGGRLLVTMPIQSERVGFNIVLEAARESLDLPEKVLKGGPLHDAERPEDVIATMGAAGFEKSVGYVLTSNTVLESIDTLLAYSWKKIGLSSASEEVQSEIRAKSIERAQAYRQEDGSYHFPDLVLAVRADR